MTMGENETALEGEAPIFGNHAGYKEGFDARLRDIGFWLSNWRYAGHSGPNWKSSRRFVPWSSAQYIDELK